MEPVISFKAIKEVFYKYIERIIEKHQTDGGLSAGEQEERGDRGPADSVGRQDVAASVWSQECGRQNRATPTFHQNMNAMELAASRWPTGRANQDVGDQDVAARKWPT